MDVLFTQIVAALAALGPIGGLGWLFSIALATYIAKELRGESLTEQKLRADIAKLNKLHNDTVIAITNNRVDDLKAVTKAYDDTLRQVLAALKRFGDKK